MNISAPFIRRPVATTLLTIAVALAGMLAFFNLPVSSLPQIDFATITVATTLPGASPEVMASSVATPLERQFGHIAGVSQMTSSSTLGICSVTLQFDLSRDVDGAARDVEAAINAARTYLPANLPANPALSERSTPPSPPSWCSTSPRPSAARANFTTPPPPSLRRSYRRLKAWARFRSSAAPCPRCAWTPIRSSSTAMAWACRM